MISQKVFDPRFGLGALGVVGREDAARYKVLQREGPSRAVTKDSQCADRFTTSKYSLLLLPPHAREHQCSALLLHNFTALRGRPPLPHTRVTIH